MSDLLSTDEGRAAVQLAQRYNLEKRLGRYLETNTNIDFANNWQESGITDLATVLGDLNADHDEELLDLYRLLGALGGLSESAQDTTYYVSEDGSDTTGDGSEDNPYASLWFLPNLPHRINHAYRIVIIGAVGSDTDNLLFNFEFGYDGYLSVIGQGAPTVVQSGFTVVAISAPGGLTSLNSVEMDIATPVSLADNFLRYTSGAFIDQARAIWWSDGANTFYTPSDVTDVSAGDTAEVICPSPSLTCNTMTIQCTGANTTTSTSEDTARLTFCNLEIVHNYTYDESFLLDSRINTNMSFVKMSGRRNVIRNSTLNTAASIDAELSSYSGLSIVDLRYNNIGLILRQSGTPSSMQNLTYLTAYGSSEIKRIYTTGIINLWFGTFQLQSSGMSGLAIGEAAVDASYLYIWGQSDDEYSAAIFAESSNCDLGSMLIFITSNILSVLASTISSYDLYLVGSVGYYEINIDGCSNVLYGESSASWPGNGIRSTVTSTPTITSLPAAGASVSDGLGSTVTQYD